MPTVELFQSDREFRIWSYAIGHRELTLRSVKEADLPTRIDIRFVDVRSIELPTTLTRVALLVETAARSPEELTLDGIAPGERAGPYPDGRRFVLSGVDYRGSVVAIAAAVHEDQGEWHEPAYWDDPRHLRRDV